MLLIQYKQAFFSVPFVRDQGKYPIRLNPEKCSPVKGYSHLLKFFPKQQ